MPKVTHINRDFNYTSKQCRLAFLVDPYMKLTMSDAVTFRRCTMICHRTLLSFSTTLPRRRHVDTARHKMEWLPESL